MLDQLLLFLEGLPRTKTIGREFIISSFKDLWINISLAIICVIGCIEYVFPQKFPQKLQFFNTATTIPSTSIITSTIPSTPIITSTIPSTITAITTTMHANTSSHSNITSVKSNLQSSHSNIMPFNSSNTTINSHILTIPDTNRLYNHYYNNQLFSNYTTTHSSIIKKEFFSQLYSINQLLSMLPSTIAMQWRNSGQTINLYPSFAASVEYSTSGTSMYLHDDRNKNDNRMKYKYNIHEINKKYKLLQIKVGFIRPLTTNIITSKFGPRNRPVPSFHKGVDFAAKIGTPVMSACDGVVITAAYQNGYGNVVVVEKDKYRFVYAHLSKVLVKAGERVDAGYIVGHVGNTGRSTAAHLHFEIRIDGTAVDPLKYLQTV